MLNPLRRQVVDSQSLYVLGCRSLVLVIIIIIVSAV